MILRAAALAVAVLAAGAASAEEAIRTAGPGAPPVAAAGSVALPTDSSDRDARNAQEIGDWARRVLAGEPSREAEADAQPPPRCQPIGDGKPHGEVWVGIGNRGYREIGGVVTQPIGDCGSVTVAVSHTEGDFGPRPRR